MSIDTAHGHSANVIKTIERVKGSWPELAVTAGNVVTEDGVEALAKAGADAVKVGVGAGSICTTRVVSGAGMPQLSAIYFASKRAKEMGIEVMPPSVNESIARFNAVTDGSGIRFAIDHAGEIQLNRTAGVAAFQQAPRPDRTVASEAQLFMTHGAAPCAWRDRSSCERGRSPSSSSRA